MKLPIAAVLLTLLICSTSHAQGQRTTEVYPLLPMIFFGHDSSDIPSRYALYQEASQTAGFMEDTLTWTLNAYYNYLNVLGSRMRRYPSTSIQVVGCKDTVTEKAEDLSHRRATRIAKYLIDVWQIDQRRITIIARGYPDQRSNPKMQEGIEENRRTEVIATDWELVKPVSAKVNWEGYREPGERYEIIRFNFDSWDMGQFNRRYFEESILPRISPVSTVNVYGHENYHDPEHTIGFRRAREVAKLIKLVKSSVTVNTPHPQPRYDQSPPEGRFYHRSVMIEILR